MAVGRNWAPKIGFPGTWNMETFLGGFDFRGRNWAPKIGLSGNYMEHGAISAARIPVR